MPAEDSRNLRKKALPVLDLHQFRRHGWPAIREIYPQGSAVAIHQDCRRSETFPVGAPRIESRLRPPKRSRALLTGASVNLFRRVYSLRNRNSNEVFYSKFGNLSRFQFHFQKES
jgi:hypothetical protein